MCAAPSAQKHARQIWKQKKGHRRLLEVCCWAVKANFCLCSSMHSRVEKGHTLKILIGKDLLADNVDLSLVNYHKNSTYINWNGEIYHFTWPWLFIEETISGLSLWSEPFSGLIYHMNRIDHGGLYRETSMNRPTIRKVKWNISLDRDFSTKVQ